MLVKALALAATLAVASAVVLKHEVDLDSPLVDVKTKYNAWKSKFGKVYDTIEAEAKAMKTFATNDQFILNHNKEGHSYTVGHNEFSDLTSAEFAEQLTGYKTRDSYLRRTKNYNNELLNGFGDAPTSIDWTTKGAVTPVKNQGQCGSCWAFSTTGSTEGAYAISSGKLVSLSEQNLVDCDHNGDNGCNGGLMDNAFGFIIQNGGICTEEGYPYTAADGTCQTSCQKAVTITGHEDVPKNDEKSLLVAAAKGPVSIAIEADKPAFQMYKSGVFDNPSCGTQLDHGVLIVGYGTDSGKDYWKVKNSWGAAWGDQGYIRIVRNKNMCGISLSACYPTGAKAAPPSPGPAPGPSPGPAPGPSPGPAPGPPGPPGPIPTVATEWSANITQVVKLVNGQTKSAAGTSYQSAKHNATRFDGNGKTIISLYGNINKEMLVVDGKCQAYCPVSGTFFNRIQPGTGKKGLSKATNKGTVTINGKQTTDWEWKQLLVIIQMALVDLYLDSNQHPVVLNTEITPFNKPLGNSTETFNSFIPGDLPEGTFAVSGIETCPKSSGCQNQKGMSSFLM